MTLRELRVGAVVVTDEALLRAYGRHDGREQSGFRGGSVMEDRPELGPPVSRPLSGAGLDQERPSGHVAGVEDQRWTCTL
jgi:hypothetical protein